MIAEKASDMIKNAWPTRKDDDEEKPREKNEKNYKSREL